MPIRKASSRHTLPAAPADPSLKRDNADSPCVVLATSSGDAEPEPDFVAAGGRANRHVRGRAGTDRVGGPMRRGELFAPQERVKTQRLAAGSSLDVEHREVDRMAGERLDLVEVDALADPARE